MLVVDIVLIAAFSSAIYGCPPSVAHCCFGNPIKKVVCVGVRCVCARVCFSLYMYVYSSYTNMRVYFRLDTFIVNFILAFPFDIRILVVYVL